MGSRRRPRLLSWVPSTGLSIRKKRCIYIQMSEQTTLPEPGDLLHVASCTAFNLRKASRAVSQLFDDALRDSGIRGGQFTIMSVVLHSQPVPVKDLAEKLVMDRTTLTRNLKPLERDGLIRIEAGNDRRVREVSMTEQGTAVLKQAYPRWREAQSRMITGLGESSLEELLSSLQSTIGVIRE